MSFIRFFTISIFSACAFGASVYGLTTLWRMSCEPMSSKAEMAVMHLSSKGKKASPEQVRKSARTGDIASLKLLGIAGMNFNELDALERSAVHLAIQNEHWTALELIEKFGGDFLQKDRKGRTPVSMLIEKGRIDIAQRYIAKGAGIQFRDPDNTPALMTYLRMKDFSAFEFLLKHKANPNALDSKGQSPLQLALELGFPDRAAQLMAAGASAKKLRLDDAPVIAALASDPARYNLTPDKLPSIVSGLLEAGADPEEVDPDTHLRPMMLAIRNGEKTMFEVLLANHVDTEDSLWQTILYNRVEMLETLLSIGEAVDVPGENGDTPLVSLVRNEGSLALINKLLDYGADPDQLTKEGQRLIFTAMVEKRSAALLALLKHENKPDVKLPLKYPASDAFRNLYGKKGLLDWYCRSVKDVTPLMIGVLCEDVEVVEKMIKLGAERNKRTSVKVYPIQIAAQTKNIAMQQLIIGVPHQDNLQKRKFIIDLSEQQVYFYKDGELSQKSRCSTGKSGYRTRTGMFVISDRQKHKISNIYGSSMPYFQRFSCSDFGFHYGNTGSRFASHGCIRLPMSTAKYFFYNAKVGDRVLIRP